MKFGEKVIEITNLIPTGKVTNYGHVALLAGSPRASRQVGWTLAGVGSKNEKIPWWRVVNKAGYISIRGHDLEIKEMQRDLLLAEGVEVDHEFKIDMQKYGWFPGSDELLIHH